MNAIDAGLQFQKFVWLGIILLGAIVVGALLAQGFSELVLLVGLGLWLLLLPYHASLATVIAVVTFNSALIMPLPGRPYWWEVAAMMGWTGIVITIALRRHSRDTAAILNRNGWLLFGMMIYCLNLLVIMNFRGVGFRVFGGSQIGGRLYVQQLLCSVFPLLFALKTPSEAMMVRLFSWQCVFAGSFLVSDFVFSYGGTSAFGLLYLFELPNDGFNFENQSAQLGIRRFQSLFLVGQAMILLLLLRRNLSDFARASSIWLWPVAISLLGLGTLGGHRYLIVFLGILFVICAWSQRFFTMQRMVVASLVTALTLICLYTFAGNLPFAAQRAVSVLPGIQVSRVARDDGDVTWRGRQELRRLGWEMAPSYRLLGRGFRKNESLGGGYDPFAGVREPDTFFNGFIGLLVNTGLPGTISMMLFLSAGSFCSLRIIRMLRTLPAYDAFARLCSVISAHFIASTLIFIFLHGDSEFALRSFALPAGMLMVAEYRLRLRLQLAAAARLVPRISGDSSALTPTRQPLPA
ncbi:MAG: hypothetical protein EXS36_15905 [Pedosphaera sp.]|nr:hypothetical protein [Pedosphaera sp.]